MAEFALPRSLLLEGRVANRVQAEQTKLKRHFPQFRLVLGHPERVFRGTLTTFANYSYHIDIVLPVSYPHAIPVIRAVGWVPFPNPHTYSNSELCVMKPDQWRSFMTVAFLVAKVAIWLNKYEIYLDKKVWPGNEQHDHSILYNARKWWYEL